jgi:hypothetical protein
MERSRRVPIHLACNSETLPRLITFQRIGQHRAAVPVNVAEIKIPLPKLLLDLPHGFVRASESRQRQQQKQENGENAQHPTIKIVWNL